MDLCSSKPCCSDATCIYHFFPWSSTTIITQIGAYYTTALCSPFLTWWYFLENRARQRVRAGVVVEVLITQTDLWQPPVLWPLVHCQEPSGFELGELDGRIFSWYEQTELRSRCSPSTSSPATLSTPDITPVCEGESNDSRGSATFSIA